MTVSLRPTLAVIAGSNGAGKSTLTAAVRAPHGVPVLDPDAIARALNPGAPERVAIQAARDVLARQRAYIAERRSFAVETTLAGTAILRQMEDARQQGFVVHLIYIGVESVQIAIDRIAIRVAKGGHHIPDEDVQRRYVRSLSHLRAGIERADEVTVVDNTLDEGPRAVVTMAQGQITLRAETMPRWVAAALGEIVRQDETRPA